MIAKLRCKLTSFRDRQDGTATTQDPLPVEMGALAGKALESAFRRGS